MLIPRLDKVFIYTCNGKYSKKNLRNFIKYIKINHTTGVFWWIGCVDKGYGRFGIGSNYKYINIGAHRVAYEMATGILIPKDKVVMHKNDIPLDVNPNNLKLGTTQENTQDKVNKKRQLIGDRNPAAKFTLDLVNNIRKDWNTGEYTHRQLTDKYKMSKANICAIINNKIWYNKDYIKVYFKKGNSKTNKEQIDEIFTLYITNKYSQRKLAKIFNLTQSTIGRIIQNKRSIKIPSPEKI